MNALDFVLAICHSLNSMDKASNKQGDFTPYPIHTLITHVIYVKQGIVPVPIFELEVCDYC